MNPRVMLNYKKQSICGANFTQLGVEGKMVFLSARTRCEAFFLYSSFATTHERENKWRSYRSDNKFDMRAREGDVRR